MILISHRGNVNGRNPHRENRQDYIQEALDNDYEVEIDVWHHQHEFYLGHDEPQYKVDEKFLQNEKLWCHAKNIDALNSMIENGKIHCFWHQEDDVTLTSERYLWTYPGKDLTPNSISVLPDNKPDVEVAGVCSDFIVRFV